MRISIREQIKKLQDCTYCRSIFTPGVYYPRHTMHRSFQKLINWKVYSVNELNPQQNCNKFYRKWWRKQFLKLDFVGWVNLGNLLCMSSLFQWQWQWQWDRLSLNSSNNNRLESLDGSFVYLCGCKSNSHTYIIDFYLHEGWNMDFF